MSSRIRYMYLRDNLQQPIGCLAIKLHRKKEYLEYQVSVVNPLDRIDRFSGKSVPFNRNMARDLALGRLVSQGLIVNMDGDANMNQITLTVMQDLASIPAPSHLPGSGDVPARAIKAAKIWLQKRHA